MPHREQNISIVVTFRHTEPTEALKEYGEEKLRHALEKFISGTCEARLILNVEKRDHIAEVHLHAAIYDIKAKAVTEDLYSAIDKVVDNVSVQLKKKKDQVTEHKGLPLSEMAPAE